ncbi:MAG TPA: penicillin-binding transpeptidase domain-containing protein [Thermoanaerobaculia bacterium]|nr:penicillin-binding transpeptidase domain-containing protein [Thermoanaerobaculia bacterium]
MKWLIAMLLAVPAAGGECFMLQSLTTTKRFVSDAAECKVRTSPASTFKVPHSLFALETGVVTDPLALVKWDRTDHSFDVWERDHSMDSAMKWSVLWFFRRTAGLIGRERMLRQLKNLRYGSDSFEGELTSFWVNGDLVVSPEEQLTFLRRMFRYELPVRRKHVDAVKTAMLMPPGKITNASGVHDFALTAPNAIVRAKTGNTTVNSERSSWIVGHVAVDQQQYVFVARVRAPSAPGTAGAELARRYLNERLNLKSAR